MEADLILWLLWRIWKNRNEFVFQGKDYNALATIVKAREDGKEWKSRDEVKMKEVKKPATEEPQQRWKPPPPERLKCNTDGTWKQETGDGGAG